MGRKRTLRSTAVFLAVIPALLLSPARASSGTVNVFYAGSLVNLNETLIGPAFASATGNAYQGKAAGSLAIVNQIKGKLSTPDVVEFADPTVNGALTGTANGDYVKWYFVFARTQLVVGFDPRSRFAAEFRLVQKHKLPWYKALEQSGLRLGRTDPNLDPKGYRALFLAGLAQKVYHLHGFERRVLGSAENPAQTFSEEVLVARMLTGQLDAGIFYLSEVRDLGLPYITLPARVNLGEQKYAKLYASQHFLLATGKTVRGAPILFTITIPSTVRNETGAEQFVQFVLSKRVRALAGAHGLLPTVVMLQGTRDAVPSSLARYIGEK